MRNMSKYDFMHSTPSDVELYIIQYDKRIKAENELIFERMKYAAWLNGLYVRMAVGSVLSKRSKYPKEPLGSKENTNEHIVAREDMTDEEKEELTRLFFDNLNEMQENFEKSKMGGED